jgi:hypothetical protein
MPASYSDMVKTAGTGWIQVTLVCLNTWQIAHGKLAGAVIVSFLISLVWTCNVRTAAFGSWWDRVIYCFGAAGGCATGLWLGRVLY